jgi:hypothetical protein
MRHLLLFWAVLLLAGCAGPKYQAVTDFDQSFDFSAVDSVAIMPIDRLEVHGIMISDMQVERINAALAAELAGKGVTVVDDPAAADMLLSWHLVTREKTDVRSYNSMSYYNCWMCGPSVSDVSVRQYTEGTFIVDMIDPMRNRSVWRATIQSRLKAQPDPEKAAENRAAAARAVFAEFPPSD